MWDAKKSLTLSKVCTILCMAALAGVLIGGPWLVRWLFETSTSAQGQSAVFFYLTLYGGGSLGAVLLVWLYLLLANIGAGRVFTHQNVSLLRRISWCCFIGAAVGGVSAFYYLPWGLVGVAAAFAGLIVRVVKNVIAQAIILKEENDFTI